MLEIVLSLLGEFFLELFGELLVELGSHAWSKGAKKPISPWLGA
ncbi:hypothetical protein PVT67_10110 [Gallaecimonas kandeliae]|nr:hypothetical protein [Gallaecimonas kandeliae]WKE64054.1 hypothetical protein PVT67_10110 [Gallaecimonas kandeliae]